MAHTTSHTGRAAAALLICVVLGLPGCPGLFPSLAVLEVSPTVLDFGGTVERINFGILNAGTGTLTWTVTEVVRSEDGKTWVEQDVSWLTIDEDTRSGTATDKTERVFLNADRQGLAVGSYSGAGVRVESNGGTAVIPVALTVTGVGPAEGEGEGEGETGLVISPAEVGIQGLGATGSFTVTNQGTTAVQWHGEIAVDSPDADATTPIQISMDPISKVTLGKAVDTVNVWIPDPDNFDLQSVSYIITIREGGPSVVDGAVIAEVSVFVELIESVVIDVDPNVLDFGEDGYQFSFLVGNFGDPVSLLDFGFFTREEAGEEEYVYTSLDTETDPLLLAVDAPEGTQNVRVSPFPTDPWYFAREVLVTINRDGIKDDVEYREIYVAATAGEEDGVPVFDPDVEPIRVAVRVQAEPYVEGAFNRSLPPSIMRFIFMLRDKRGIPVNAADPFVRSQISFRVTEDDAPLDLDEGSLFISSPEKLRCSVVVLLDYTGSMYRAGVDDPLNPLAPGDAIEQMVEAAKQFILSLPDSYRVAVMEYHGRGGELGRLVHGFDTDKHNVIRTLDAFTIPVAEHGGSEVHDAVYDACQALWSDDPLEILPFDETDVRVLVFVSDGWDTSSVREMSEVVTFAQEARVRLYPIGFGGRASNPVDGVSLIQMAAETGGHAYYATEAKGLTELLDTTSALSFDKTDIDSAGGTATLRLRNNGARTLTWQAITNLDWLALSVPPEAEAEKASSLSDDIPPETKDSLGVIVEPGVRELIVTASAAGMSAGSHNEGYITLTSDGGNATVLAAIDVGEAGTIANFSLVPVTEDPGKISRALQGHVVLTYTSLLQEGSHTYSIDADFTDNNGEAASAMFEKDGVFYPGDERAGQATLTTAGINDGVAEIYVRTNYVPRNITQFRFRFIIGTPVELLPDYWTPEQRQALRVRLTDALDDDAVSVVHSGLLSGWRLIKEGHGVFTLVTEPDDYITYGDFGDLLKLRFEGLEADDAFEVGIRVDNALYFSPASSTSASQTKYFLYAGGHLNPEKKLIVASGSDLAGPARSVLDFMEPFDPEDPLAWDRDEDSWADFDDSEPEDEDVGDLDSDGVPDLDDPAPTDENIP